MTQVEFFNNPVPPSSEVQAEKARSGSPEHATPAQWLAEDQTDQMLSPGKCSDPPVRRTKERKHTSAKGRHVFQKQGFSEIVQKIRTALLVKQCILGVAKGLIKGVAHTSRRHYEVEDKYGPRFTADAQSRVTSVLLNYPSFLEMRGPFGDTVLHDCILYLENDRSFYHSLARHLVHLGGKPLVTATYTHKNYYGETAAHLCCVNAYVALFKFLVANGADVANSTAIGEFFLPYPQRENIQVELRRRAQAKQKAMSEGMGKHKKQAWSTAMSLGYNLKKLSRRRFVVPEEVGVDDSNTLGDKELLLPPPEILEKITDDKACCYYGPFVVNFAACTGQMEMVNLCVAAGADITATDAFGNTILHCLVIAEMAHNEGCLFEVIFQIVKLCGPQALVQRNHDGYDPLMLAVKEGHLEVFTKIVAQHQHVLWSFGPVRCFYVPLDSFLWQADQTVPSVMGLLGQLPAYAFCDEPIPQLLLQKIWTTLKWQFFLLRLFPMCLLLASITASIMCRPGSGWQQAHGPNATGNETIDEGAEETTYWYDHSRINTYALANMASERYRLAAELTACVIGTCLLVDFASRFLNHVTWVVHGGRGVYAGVKSFLMRAHNPLMLLALLLACLVPISRYFFVEGEHVLLPLMAVLLCFHIIVDMQLVGGFGPVIIAMLASFSGDVTYFTLVFTLCVLGFALVVDLQEPRLEIDTMDDVQVNQVARTTGRFMRIFMSGFGGDLPGWDDKLWDTEDALNPLWMEFGVYFMWIVTTQILFRSVIVAIMAHSFSVEGYTYEYVMWQKRAAIISELLEWGRARKAVQRMLERTPDFMQVDPEAEFPLGWTCIRTVQRNRQPAQRKPWTAAGNRQIAGYGKGGHADKAFGKLRLFKRDAHKNKRRDTSKKERATKEAMSPGKRSGALGKGAPWNRLRKNINTVIDTTSAMRRLAALQEAKAMVDDGLIPSEVFDVMQENILEPEAATRRATLAPSMDTQVEGLSPLL